MYDESLIKYSDNNQITQADIELFDDIKDYFKNAKSKNTRKAYKSDWDCFTGFCDQRKLCSVPASPQTVMIYIAELAKSYKVSSISRRLTTITLAHKEQGYDTPVKDPKVQTLFKGIKNTKGIKQNGKIPMLTEDIKAIIKLMDMRKMLHVRDRAVLLLGFSGAFRRSEIVGLNYDDIEFVDRGMLVTLKKSKTDQEGHGIIKGIEYGNNSTCPVSALKFWLECTGINDGALFPMFDINSNVTRQRMLPQGIRIIVKRWIKRIGKNPDLYAGHSLRAGFATQGAMNGASAFDLMKDNWKSRTMLDRYVRKADAFDKKVDLGL